MFPKTRLLTAVSAAAISVAAGGAALANVSPQDIDHGRARAVVGDIHSARVFELLGLIGGKVTAETVEWGLRSLFQPLTAERAAELPSLVAALKELGWRQDVFTSAVREMGDLISSSPALASDPDRQLALAAAVGAQAGMTGASIRVAQAGSTDTQLCLYRPTDPRYKLDPNCPPLATGTVPRVDGPPPSTGTINGY